ncbi:hypothetical protein [Serratia entomophila]|uniref:Uncharacterized protein n=1 Tax=Serratia entomophila TaxID=42906 RepID=A0ABY5CX24_9GAMM|nr:hypothetical protein [Serratia entomophila]UIW19510.1 hypothetical protein KHA73_06050 [Serratia entomophila]USV02035.1 hypothetical protein KFQ06_05800 [Serratia entomophila]
MSNEENKHIFHLLRLAFASLTTWPLVALTSIFNTPRHGALTYLSPIFFWGHTGQISAALKLLNIKPSTKPSRNKNNLILIWEYQ